MALTQKSTKRYLNILGSAGDFRETVDQGTPGAKLREYETSDGKKGSKYEIPYSEVGGTIVDMELYDGDYGVNLIITMDIGEDEPIGVSISTNSPYGESILKMLPNIDFNKEVNLKPYNFVNDEGRTVRGIVVKQDGEKLTNAFVGENKEPLLGYPTPDGDTDSFSSDDWKLFYLTARKHMIKYAEENVLPQFEGGKEGGEEL